MPEDIIDNMSSEITKAFVITLEDLKELLPAIIKNAPEDKDEFVEKLIEDRETIETGLDLPEGDKFKKE